MEDKIRLASSIYESIAQKRTVALSMCDQMESTVSIEDKERLRKSLLLIIEEIDSIQELYYNIIKS